MFFSVVVVLFLGCWIHVSCALWHAEPQFVDQLRRTPVRNVPNIHKKRMRLVTQHTQRTEEQEQEQEQEQRTSITYQPTDEDETSTTDCFAKTNPSPNSLPGLTF